MNEKQKRASLVLEKVKKCCCIQRGRDKIRVKIINDVLDSNCTMLIAKKGRRGWADRGDWEFLREIPVRLDGNKIKRKIHRWDLKILKKRREL